MKQASGAVPSRSYDDDSWVRRAAIIEIEIASVRRVYVVLD